MNRPPRASRVALRSAILPLAWGVALATALAGASAIGLTLALEGAHAAEAGHEQAHAHGHQQQPATQPANAAQPATTQALRTGMTRLRQTLQAQPRQALDTAAALRLQSAVEADIAALIEECELPAKADAVLHGVLAELLQGAAALHDPASRAAGLQRLDDGLQSYSALFAAPHWSPAQAAID